MKQKGKEERDMGVQPFENAIEGREIVVYAGDAQIVDSMSEGREVIVQAVENVGMKAASREKLQVRGRGRGTKKMRGSLGSEEGDDPFNVQGRGCGSGPRSRRGRGRGKKAREGDGREAGAVVDTAGSFASDHSDEPLCDDLRQPRSRDNPGRVNGRCVTQPSEAEGGTTLEENREQTQWLLEITIISSFPFDSHWASTSPQIRLAFDDSEASSLTCGPSLYLPLFKSAITSISTEFQKGLRQSCNDIVMHAGGPIWAMDWCPRRPGWVCSGTEKSEFLAVGAHPSQVPYNRLGKALKGRGLIQIWAFDFSTMDRLDADIGEVKGGTRTAKSGRANCCDQRPAGPSPVGRSRGGKGSGRSRGRGLSRTDVRVDSHGDVLQLGGESTGQHVLSSANCDIAGEADLGLVSSDPDAMTPSKPHSIRRPWKLKESARARGSDTDANETSFPLWNEEEGPAKVVMCLAHEGVVTWDVKWRPVGEMETPGMQRELLRLGYLAVLLGDGSIQVFDVPLPSILAAQSRKLVSLEEPVTVRIRPVFSCSDLQSGGHKSIPLSLEWSTWNPHDLILVGFHDATVGVWKFSPDLRQPETRPLIFFTADTLPLRAVAWAPDGSGSSGKHMFVTAGQSGWVKFWDIRDPFRPFWDLQVARGCIYGLDWLPWPRCLLMTLDDGTLRILGLDNASSQTPITGEPWKGTHTQGLQCYLCSTFHIWDVQVSRSTGVVAYAGANGSVLQFQLTERAVIKEGSRTREPHYRCGAFVADSEGGPVTLTSTKRTAPAQMRKSSTEWSSTPRTKRGFLATCTLDNESRQVTVSTSGVLDLPFTTESPGPRKRKKHSKAIGKIRNKDLAEPSSSQRSHFELGATRIDDGKMAVVPLETPLILPDGLNVRQSFLETKNMSLSGPPPRAENFPYRKVAVHRLRWNRNSGRQDWLAYGGAAGIIRCQQVFSMKKKTKGDF